MALPKAIQRQSDEAEAIYAQQQASREQAQAVVTDPAQIPANEPQAPEPQNAAPPPPAPAPSDDWQQKYKSLQGMFAQRTGELQSQNKAYESQLTNMQRQIDALMQVKQQEETKGKKTADPKDVEDFGADLVDMVQKYSERVFQSMSEQFAGKAAELDTRLKTVEQQVTGVSDRTNTTLEQQFYATLKAMVPDWEQVNQDSRWLTWLSEVDPIYGATRQVALDYAHKNMDVNRVASVFNAFKTAHPVKPRSSLDNQVAPTGSASNAPASPQGKPVFSSKFVEKFYNEYAKGIVYKGREDEAARIVAEIDIAAAEGRIR